MSTLILKTNALAAATLIKDIGLTIPAAGATNIDQSTPEEILDAVQSEDLRAFVVDNAHTVTSTIILNDGTSDIAQADALNFLDSLLPAAADLDFGVWKNNAAGQLDKNVAMDGTATFSNLKAGTDIDANNFKLLNLTAGVAGTDGVNLNQLNSAVSAGQRWKELVLVVDQLDSVNDAVSQAIAFYLDGQPADGDTLTITDGTTTEIFTWKNTPTVAKDIQIGASADATMDNMATTITADSALWKAVVGTALNQINSGSGTSTAGRVLVIMRADQSADTFSDRIFGTLTTPANAQYVSFAGAGEYGDESTVAQLPAADPAVKEFGFGRSTASLIANEVHGIRNGDDARIWDADGLAWNTLPGTNRTFSNGLVLAANNVSPDYGLLASIQETAAAGGNAAGVQDKFARADHAHAHADHSGSASTYHDGASITAPAGLTNIGSPADVDAALTNINANAVSGKFAGKHAQFGLTSRVPSGAGEKYMKSAGEITGSSAGLRMLRAGKLSGASIQVEKIDATRAYKLSVRINGVEVESVALPVSTLGAQSVALTSAYAAGDLLSCAVALVSGSGNSDFKKATGVVEYVAT